MLSNGPALIDITAQLDSPVRTGIQRVVRAVIRHWPTPETLMLCRCAPGQGMLTVSRDVIPWITDATAAARAASFDEITQRITPMLANSNEPVPDDAAILVLDGFYNLARCAEHRKLLDADRMRIAYLLHDLIPFLQPAMVGITISAPMMPYLSLIRDAGRVCFTSPPVRADFARRIRRQTDLSEAALGAVGPVIPLGADGPAIPRQTFSPARRTYLCIGSVDGRKNQDAVIAAFRTLWASGSDARLVMVGRVFDHVHRAGGDAALRALADEPRFSHIADINDDAFAALYSQARATIYVSHVEGYGLPPIESLLAGVPVIVSAQTPSIGTLPRLGQIRIDPAAPGAILDAVLQMETDATAERLWQDAASLELPHWRQTSAAIANWFAPGLAA